MALWRRAELTCGWVRPIRAAVGNRCSARLSDSAHIHTHMLNFHPDQGPLSTNSPSRPQQSLRSSIKPVCLSGMIGVMAHLERLLRKLHKDKAWQNMYQPSNRWASGKTQWLSGLYYADFISFTALNCAEGRRIGYNNCTDFCPIFVEELW